MDFTDITVLCVGDVMLDRFVHGEIERISPEAPVPVLHLTGTREMLGGTGNVASNIAALGGRAVLIGLVGEDANGARLREIVAGHAGIEARLVTTAHRPTVCKTRFVAGRQQVVRADEERRAPAEPDEVAALRAAIDAAIGKAAALVLSDYGKGTLGPALMAHAAAAARARGIAVFVDPKSADFADYRGATCLTPNLRELALASAMPVGTEAEIIAAARHVMARAEAQAVLVTRSEKGMMLVEHGEVAMVPSRAREVFDVSGAGDTVIAALALAHASGRSLVQAMHIANAAAGVVVSKLGTATADLAEVLRELSAQEAPGSLGLQTLARTQALVSHWRDQGFVVGFTNGCFDILHPGHVALLEFARVHCDRLVVGLNSDASVRRLKGETRPVNALEPRARVLAAIRHVDCVVGFEADTPAALIAALLPDLLVKGADYTVDNVVGADVVLARGGRVLLAELVPEQSTTRIIGRLQGGA